MPFTVHFLLITQLRVYAGDLTAIKAANIHVYDI